MSKQKQKIVLINNPKKLILISFSLFAVILIVYILCAYGFKKIEDSKILKEEQSILNQSLVEVKDVYYKFANMIPGSKEYTQEPQNLCSEISSKSIDKDYGCGNRSEIKFSSVDEVTYTTVNNKINDIYKQNNSFKNINIEQPVEVDYKNGKSGSINSTFRNSGLRCFLSSFYDRDAQLATFNIGCSLIAQEAIFPLKD